MVSHWKDYSDSAEVQRLINHDPEESPFSSELLGDDPRAARLRLLVEGVSRANATGSMRSAASAM